MTDNTPVSRPISDGTFYDFEVNIAPAEGVASKDAWLKHNLEKATESEVSRHELDEPLHAPISVLIEVFVTSEMQESISSEEDLRAVLTAAAQRVVAEGFEMSGPDTIQTAVAFPTLEDMGETDYDANGKTTATEADLQKAGLDAAPAAPKI